MSELSRKMLADTSKPDPRSALLVFEEALGKAPRSLENGRAGLGADGRPAASEAKEGYRALLERPTSDRIVYVGCALRSGWTPAEVHAATGIDPFFLHRMADVIAVQEALRGTPMLIAMGRS